MSWAWSCGSFNIAELSDANLKLVDRFKKLQQMVKKTVSTFEEQQAKKQSDLQKKQKQEQKMLDGKRIPKLEFLLDTEKKIRQKQLNL